MTIIIISVMRGASAAQQQGDNVTSYQMWCRTMYTVACKPHKEVVLSKKQAQNSLPTTSIKLTCEYILLIHNTGN